MSIISTGSEVVGFLEVAAICGVVVFECCRMSFARLAEASIASFVGSVFSSFCGDEEGVTQVLNPFQ